jgi:cytochrome c oxidase subunit 3
MSLLRKISAKPWEHAGELEGLHGAFTPGQSAGRTGLYMFLAVVTSFFLLFMVTYYTRMQFPDWEMLADPKILWANTAVLILASLALQLASNAAKLHEFSRMRNWLLAGGILTLVFIGGQWVAWEQLVASGYYARSNPANAFFYLFTGLHALHLAGGIWFMALLGFRLNQPNRREQVPSSVTLCATYWHYLLLVWLVLFTLLLRT